MLSAKDTKEGKDNNLFTTCILHVCKVSACANGPGQDSIGNLTCNAPTARQVEGIHIHTDFKR